MEKENMVYIHDGMLFSHKEEWMNLVICSKMDGTGGHYFKWNKLDTERQIVHVLSHMWKVKESNRMQNSDF
jgi:hypothetical protein